MQCSALQLYCLCPTSRLAKLVISFHSVLALTKKPPQQTKMCYMSCRKSPTGKSCRMLCAYLVCIFRLEIQEGLHEIAVDEATAVAGLAVGAEHAEVSVVEAAHPTHDSSQCILQAGSRRQGALVAPIYTPTYFFGCC